MLSVIQYGGREFFYAHIECIECIDRVITNNYHKFL